MDPSPCRSVKGNNSGSELQSITLYGNRLVPGSLTEPKPFYFEGVDPHLPIPPGPEELRIKDPSFPSVFTLVYPAQLSAACLPARNTPLKYNSLSVFHLKSAPDIYGESTQRIEKDLREPTKVRKIQMLCQV